MTWMVLRLVLSLGLIALVLVYANKLAKKRGLGGANELIEVVARQRMGRASSVSVLRVAGRVLVVGATDAQVTLLAEVDDDDLATSLAAVRTRPASADEDGEDGEAHTRRLPTHRPGGGALAGSVLDRGTWTSVVQELRERTVRRP